MGTVFMALQKKPIRRKVALKVIKPGMDSKQVVSRFEAERQALAIMDHPNIARVIDGGATQSGRPYFVMELVKGIRISDYCDRNRLTTKDRLELFIDVCKAVQHAHQKGIIHRDLKPSNILVTLLDGKAIPKIIDFGIAKAIHGHLTDDSLVTNLAQLVGTPLYMSPEQAELSAADVDTRSDVYSLGVLLYELLTGTTPFDRARMSSVSFDEFRRIVREEEPPRPSTRLSTLDAALEIVAEKHHTDPRTLTRDLSGELDWIAMKTLEKDRTRRYDSANELAKDVQRHLDDEPVEACPPSRAYRLKKFARRNKTALVTAATLLLTLILGASIAMWQAAEARRQRDLANLAAANEQRQRVEAERQQQIAQENFERARNAVNEYLTKVSEDTLLNQPSMQPLRKDLLELALKYFRQFVAERGDDPALQSDLADAYFRVGTITAQIGSPGEALKTQQTAQGIYRKLVAQHPTELDYQHNLATIYQTIGELQKTTGKRAEAFASIQKGVSIQQQLAGKNPDDVKLQNSLARDYHDLGELQQAAGKSKESLTSLQKAVAISEPIVKQHPGALEYQKVLASCYNGQAMLLATGAELELRENGYLNCNTPVRPRQTQSERERCGFTK